MSRRSVTRPEVRVGGFWLSSIAPQGWGQLKHATRKNGAWQVSWTIPDTRTWRHPALAYGAPVELMLGPVCLAAATLEEPDWDAGQFVALGACRDGETAVSITAGGATTTKPNTAIDAAIARGVVSWTRVGDFGTTAVGDIDSGGGLVTLQSVLDAWAEENDSNWAVDNQRNLVIAPTDETTVDWLIVPGSGVLGSAAEERVDRIFVRYVDSTTHRRATISYPASTPAGGVEKPVDITDRGPMTSAKATSIATGMWSDLQGRSGWTNGLTLKGGQITTLGGVEADLALPKAGDTARLLGVPDQRGVALHTDIVIGDTEYDWEEDEIQVNPEGLAARDVESVLEQVGNLAVDAAAIAASKSSLSFSDYVRTGITLCTPVAANTTVTVAVVFDEPLPTAPQVTVAPSSASNDQMEARALNVTTTGFDLAFRRSTTAAANVRWIAVSLP